MSVSRKLTPEEKAELLARLEAKAARLDALEASERWQDLGAQEEPDDTPRSAAGWAALARMFELIEQERPRWQRDALCLEHPELPWFPEKGEDTAACREVCARCPCADECAAYALDIGAKAGVWAGASARTLKRRQAA